MKITLHLFGAEARLIGQRLLTIDWPEPQISSDQLARQIRQLYPQLSRSTFRLAVNHEFAGADQPIHETDEVAIIGPVSGG